MIIGFSQGIVINIAQDWKQQGSGTQIHGHFAVSQALLKKQNETKTTSENDIATEHADNTKKDPLN